MTRPPLLLVALVALEGMSSSAVVPGFVTLQQLQRRRRKHHWVSRLCCWSQQAVVVINDDDNIQQEQGERSICLASTLVEQQQDHTTSTATTTTLDLGSPRAWLQHQTAGVYTVMRVDWLDNNDDSCRHDDDRIAPGWHTWGLDFHLQRLQQSYATLYPGATPQSETCVAVQDSMAVVKALLQAATTEVAAAAAATDAGESNCVMLTLLWHPTAVDNNKNETMTQVKGHVLTVAKPAIPSRALDVVLALSNDRLVNRKDHYPECKQSSWCTDRIPLEIRFKSDSQVDEVLLMHSDDDKECILEGLTSNCFFVYDNMVLKTPAQDVLLGYARHRVIQTATAMGWRVELGPVSLDEAAEWRLVFLTSAIRLVQPVQTISRIDDNNENRRVVVWQAQEEDNASHSVVTSILDKILQQEGL